MADQPDNVFSKEGTVPPENEVPPKENLEDLLKDIKNENGEQKYKSLKDALVALGHSQKYIPELKDQLSGTQRQLEDMKLEMGKLNNIEETVQRLLAKKSEEEDTPPKPQGLDEQAVIKLVQESLMANKQSETLSANQKKVNDALVSKYGEKAVEVLDNKAAELHTTRQALGELSKQNPYLVLALFGNAQVKDQNLTTPSMRTPPPKSVEGLRKIDKSMLSGVSLREQAERLKEIRAHIHRSYSIEN